MTFKPIIDLGLFMIGGIVLNQINPVASSIIGWQQDLFEKRHIRDGVEVFGLMAPYKPPVRNADGAQHFLRVALAARRDLRLRTQRRPGLVQRRRLAERGLVLMHDYRPFGAGFFFRLGYS